MLWLKVKEEDTTLLFVFNHILVLTLRNIEKELRNVRQETLLVIQYNITKSTTVSQPEHQ